MSEVVKDLNLFTILERGDRRIDTLKDKVIMMVGRTRAGKSCTFNWILGRDMIGEGDQIQAFYVNLNKSDSEAAELSNQFASKTLIPNLADLDSDVSLIDMAGYGDTRNYIGVMGVSYFLKSVFERAKEVKFLIVFNEHEFFDVTGSAIIKTFNGFISMFKEEKLTPEIKQKLFGSISLIVTRAKSPHMHAAYLSRVVKKLKIPEFKCENKALMTEILENLISINRLNSFEMAAPNDNPKKCDILEHFGKMKWEFLKMSEVNVNGSIINIPFQADYDPLPQEQKNQFLFAISERIELYTKFSLIIKELMSSLKDNWKITFENTSQKLPENFMDDVLNFDRVFVSIEHFLQEGDKYNSQNLVTQTVKAEYPRLSLVESIRKVLNIYEVADRINNQIDDFTPLMIKYTDLFSELSSCILPFCVNAAQEKQVLRLKFILTRGFREFIKFYEINPYIISRVSQDMKDKCSMNINQESSSIFIEHFIRNMSKDLLTRLFKTIPQISDYEQMFIEYRSRFMLPEENYLRIDEDFKLNKLHIGINFVKADIHLRNGDRVNAGVIFVSLLQLLCRQGLLVDEMDPNNMNIEDKLNELYMQKLQVIQKIVKVLIALEIRRYPNAQDLALSLCDHTKEIDAACDVYQLKLDSYPNDIPKLVSIYQNYADYCIKWGRYSDAKKLLQKKLRLQNYNFIERVETVNAIYQLVEDYSRFVDEQKQNISKIGRLLQNDSLLNNLLIEIQGELS